MNVFSLGYNWSQTAKHSNIEIIIFSRNFGCKFEFVPKSQGSRDWIIAVYDGKDSLHEFVHVEDFFQVSLAILHDSQYAQAKEIVSTKPKIRFRFTVFFLYAYPSRKTSDSFRKAALITIANGNRSNSLPKRIMDSLCSPTSFERSPAAIRRVKIRVGDLFSCTFVQFHQRRIRLLSHFLRKRLRRNGCHVDV